MGCRQIATEEKNTASSFTSSRFNPPFAAAAASVVWEKLKMKWILKRNLAFSKQTNSFNFFFISFIFQFYLLLLTEVILQTFYNILFRFQLLFFPPSEWEREVEENSNLLFIHFCVLYFSLSNRKMLEIVIYFVIFYAKKFNFYHGCDTSGNKFCLFLNKII